MWCIELNFRILLWCFPYGGLLRENTLKTLCLQLLARWHASEKLSWIALFFFLIRNFRSWHANTSNACLWHVVTAGTGWWWPNHEVSQSPLLVVAWILVSSSFIKGCAVCAPFVAAVGAVKTNFACFTSCTDYKGDVKEPEMGTRCKPACSAPDVVQCCVC